MTARTSCVCADVSSDSTRLCGERHPTLPAVCTRELGHDDEGTEHVACGPHLHRIATWAVCLGCDGEGALPRGTLCSVCAGTGAVEAGRS